MKKIFLNEIMPSIEDYHLLNPEMQEYFDASNFYDPESTEAIIEGHYEPKKNIDFKMWSPSKAPDDVIGNDYEVLRERLRESIKNPKTYKGTFGADDDIQLDFSLNICTKRPPAPVLDDDVDLNETFNYALSLNEKLAPGVKWSPQNVILNRLADPNTISNTKDLKKLPGGVQKFMMLFPFFKETMAETNSPTGPPSDDGHSNTDYSVGSSDKENTAGNSMVIPNISTSSSTPLTETSNKAVVDRKTRSSSSQSIEIQRRRDLVLSQNPTTSRNHTPSRAKHVEKGLIKKPATNLRMANFIKNFSNQKRRRDSTSPSSGASQ